MQAKWERAGDSGSAEGIHHSPEGSRNVFSPLKLQSFQLQMKCDVSER